MIGIVVVSHSRALGEAAVALATEMVPEEARPAIAVAAGLDESTFGTDAAAIAEAITSVDSPDGVLVLMDLGSALLSAEMALEFVDPETADHVRLSSAPLIEGLVSAVVTASGGADLATVAGEAADALVAKAEQVGDAPGAAPAPAEPAPPRQAPDFVERHIIRNPHGLHARPAAALVAGLAGIDAEVTISNVTAGKGPVSARSIGKVATLGLRQGDQVEATFAGPAAESARDRFLELAASDFGESDEPMAPLPAAGSGRTGREIVWGPAVRWDAIDTSHYVGGDASAELAAIVSAVVAVGSELSRLVTAEPTQAGIFAAQRAMLEDPDLMGGIDKDLSDGKSAVEAVTDQFGQLAADFDALPDPYLRERAQDVRSLRRMILAALVGAEEPDLDTPHVLVVDELDAATAARLDSDRTLGVVTMRGGATGHGVIVASSRGIPVVTGRRDVDHVRSGDVVALDPATQQVWTDPSESDLAEIKAKAGEREEETAAAEAAAGESALTSSGLRVLVECNVASVADAEAGAKAGADGSGLVRTEILFGQLGDAPSAEAQAEAFVTIGKILGAMITVRTWDPGGDKPLAFLRAEGEANPMLGERGIRAMTRSPELLREQIRGVLLAAEQIPIRVMFPMVTEPDEMVWARGIYDEVRAGSDLPSVPVGMMVEVPAAALRAADFVGLIDFVSIGTNDLTQYVTAVDRGNGRVSALARPGHPAVLDLIAATSAGLPGVPVAVCGDLASDPSLTEALVRRGVSELSVRPPLVGLVKQAVRDIA